MEKQTEIHLFLDYNFFSNGLVLKIKKYAYNSLVPHYFNYIKNMDIEPLKSTIVPVKSGFAVKNSYFKILIRNNKRIFGFSLLYLFFI